jgi:hypothetical protein
MFSKIPEIQFLRSYIHNLSWYVVVTESNLVVGQLQFIFFVSPNAQSQLCNTLNPSGNYMPQLF